MCRLPPRSGGKSMFVEPFKDDRKVNLAKGLIAGQTRADNSGVGLEVNLAGLIKLLAAAPIICFLAACSAANGNASNDSATNTVGPVTTNGTAVAAVASSSAKIGTNLATIAYWDGARPFMNLMYGGGWSMSSATVGATDVPAEDLDANGWIKQLPSGYRAAKILSIPAASADIVCTYQGNGPLDVAGPVTNIVETAGKTTFHYNSSYPDVHWAWLAFNVDPSNYIRNIDCREAGSTTTSSFAPEFTNSLQGFKLIRFMKWQTDAVELNAGNTGQAFSAPTITWATRNKPGDGDFNKKDGVPVELEVELANQVGADPFFSMPWNADDDYITQFATYVRDHLAAGRVAYVENSNEVWNWGYYVTHQAAAEGAAEGLDGSTGGSFQQATERSAEKTKHVMQIWSTVFSGQMNRLVRVFSFQHVQPFYGEMGLKMLQGSVDAYATAPYWSMHQSDYTGQSADDILNTVLPAQITSALNFATQNKALAQKYGVRYITYEAGQDVVLPNNLALWTQVERDPRMHDLYKTYLTQWQTNIGDMLTLFNLTGVMSSADGYGMVDYAGEPVSLAATPKMQAVREFLGIATTTASAATTPTSTNTQVCPDGTVIAVTGTCPTMSTATPGKRKGTSKGSTSFKTAVA